MAKTMLFVHGTGVRSTALGKTVNLIRERAAEYLPGWSIEVCAWGDPFGAALNRHGASVPNYARSGLADASLDAQQRARWTLLADDPLIELRVTPKAQYLGQRPGPDIWKRVLSLRQHAQLAQYLAVAGLDAAWADFIDSVTSDVEWRTVVETLTLSAQAASPAMARALVAGLAAWLRERALPPLGSERRDELAKLLVAPMGGPPAGVLDWLLDRMTGYARRRRGSLTDLTSPAVGDVLRYQARGETVRAFIAQEVQRTGARVILAHSLGGIASVDWLAFGQRPIDALITVGSQAAYFYEIDALASRVIGQGLPAFFPQRWLNIHDDSDLLSYPASGVFKGWVTDLRVDNGEPFPESHSAYFDNRAEVWPAIGDFLGKL